MKYGTWKIGAFESDAVNNLIAGGYSPLTARVLCSRGYSSPEAAQQALSCECPLHDPFLLRDMEPAVRRIRLALERRETIAVYGDYDVDGITATCLLTDFLRRLGSDCVSYIPDRIGEGYGLNREAVHRLKAEGTSLIITVDCGITATEEALLCRELGIDLIITDHHECKPVLPQAVAVVDPHRPDDAYPHQDLSGVGVAFKLACALSGDFAAVLERYCDLVCLGTIADVMSLRGENRVFVAKGLDVIRTSARVGISALIAECGLINQSITAATVGYTLAPRINAAGRLGKVALAVELFLTNDAAAAKRLASELCELNRERQTIEAEIYTEAVAMLSRSEASGAAGSGAIVLAGESWHQGVVGIVASRLADEYSCPTFLICLDGALGKASSRSYGGFNLFAGLQELSHLLEGYGGHELAAGFTIPRENIDTFRARINDRVREFAKAGDVGNALAVDCIVPPQLLTLSNVTALNELEPCGEGCPRPVFCMEQLLVEQIVLMGGGKHMRLKLRWGSGARDTLNAVFFSTTPMRAGVDAGDVVDIAFTPQINLYRGARQVQISLIDIRPCRQERQSIDTHKSLYERRHHPTAAEAAELLPQREEFAAVWRYLDRYQEQGRLTEDFACLCRKIGRQTGKTYSMARIRICLDVFDELGLIRLETQSRLMHIRITAGHGKVDLNSSAIIRRLKGQAV